MRFTKRQLEVLLETIATLDETEDLDLTVNGDMDNLRFLELMMHQHPKGLRLSSIPAEFKPIIRNLITESREFCTTQTFNTMAINAMKAGCGPII